MPELPEVESVRRGVHEWTTGATVVSAQIIDPRILGTTSARAMPAEAVAGFTSSLRGLRITGTERRGKFMWLTLGGESAGGDCSRLGLLVHLGMSGQLRVHTPSEARHRHTRAILHLQRADPEVGPTEGPHPYDLRFIDQRIFGHLGLQPLVLAHDRWVPVTAAHIAPDPFEPAFDFDRAVEGLRRKRTAIKSALLDQGLISGIGNIYADEALFRARVHPQAIPARTRRSRLAAVLESAISVMRDALAVGGTSFDSLYVNVNGESGYFDRALLAYGRDGQQCVRCGTAIKKITLGGRGTHFCPRCQPKPRAR